MIVIGLNCTLYFVSHLGRWLGSLPSHKLVETVSFVIMHARAQRSLISWIGPLGFGTTYLPRSILT